MLYGIVFQASATAYIFQVENQFLETYQVGVSCMYLLRPIR